MTQKELSELTDQELLDEAKKMKSAAIMSALVIGLMIGVIIWSVVKNTVGFFTLIPLYYIYRLLNNPKDTNALEELLKERNLK